MSIFVFYDIWDQPFRNVWSFPKTKHLISHFTFIHICIHSIFTMYCEEEVCYYSCKHIYKPPWEDFKNLVQMFRKRKKIHHLYLCTSHKICRKSMVNSRNIILLLLMCMVCLHENMYPYFVPCTCWLYQTDINFTHY